MKTKIYLIAVFGIVIQAITYAQTNTSITIDNTVPFNQSFWNSYSEKLHLNPSRKKRIYFFAAKVSLAHVSYYKYKFKTNYFQSKLNPCGWLY